MVLPNPSLSLSLFLIATILRVQQVASVTESVCHLEVSNADSGILEPTDDALSKNVCMWTVSAAPGRRLLVTVESVRLNVGATLEVVTDGNATVFSGRCSDCFRNLVGRTVQVMYKGEVNEDGGALGPPLNSTLPAPSNNTLSSRLSTKPYFLITYSSFNPRNCDSPANPVDGFVEGAAVEVGSQILYRCRSPYLVERGAVSKATCVLNAASPLPTWSHPPPRCLLPDCGKTPIRITLDDDHPTTAVHSGNAMLGKSKNCVWEITTGRKKHLQSLVEYLSLPDWSTVDRQQSGAVLELYDGKMSDRRLLARLSGTLASGTVERRFTTIFNKLIIAFRVGAYGRFAFASNDPTNEGRIGDYGFHVNVSAKVPSCEIPSAPLSGDVKGRMPSADVATNTELPEWMVVYSCNAGYYLNGSDLAACLENGKWSNAAPICLPSSSTAEATTLAGHGNLSVNVEESFVHGKSPRQSKNRRPHPQSTDEKTNFKLANEDLNFFKQPSLPLTPALEAALPNSTGTSPQEEDEEESTAAAESGDDPLYPVEGGEFDDLVPSYPSENDYFNESDTGGEDFPVVPVIFGIGIPLILGVVALSGWLVYRKRYPVRMGIGRKFDTFENPVYEQNKRGPSTPGGTLLPGVSLAQSPAELQRLTNVKGF